MRGVRKCLTGYEPGLMECEILLINEDAHQFDNSYGWMSIIQLYGNFISQQVKLLIVCLLEPPDNIFDAGSTKEVLLLDDVSLHLLRYHRILVEEYRGNALGTLPRLHQVDIVIVSLAVVMLVLGLKGREGAPQAEAVRVESVVPRDGGVISHGLNELTLGPSALLHLHPVDFHDFLLDLTIELDLVCDIVALDLPWNSVRVTEVRNLDLLAKLLYDVLLKVPVVVPDSIAPCGYLESSHGIQKAGGKAT